MNYTGRLFTFGCSFTEYQWPTWADIIGREFEYFQNWGRIGAGNPFIFNSLIECNLKNHITPQDTVCVMWTSVARVDTYRDNCWNLKGNIFFDSSRFNKNCINLLSDIRGYYIRDLALIHAAMRLLNSLQCKWYFLSMVDIDDIDENVNNQLASSKDTVQDLLTAYKDTLSLVRPSVHNVIFSYDYSSRPSDTFVIPEVHEILDKKHIWQVFYNNIKDPHWPSCQDPKDFDRLPDNIKEECVSVFGLSPSTIKCNHKLLKPTKKHFNRYDCHPTPEEHCEYIIQTLPEINVSADTRNWVTEVQTLLDAQKDYTHIWNKQFPRRW